ncbi:maleylacetate reductase [Marivirga salinae]|uniref:Maleylacetate reductase n=1 Tax=Marivirga salinarum TaxID=3059078 RepID=A0AA49JH56_9BACT|nr:maleylacetate reductase [Marivirga sp. BDSF4-3]WKK78267.2 maleylacetate reductase [Marivirga sp. BDSF4-3]
MNFNYTSYPNQVIFGKGKTSDLPKVLENYSKIMAFGEDRWATNIQHVADAVGKNNLFYFDEIIQHVPQHLVDKAMVKLKSEKPDVLLAFGGGSAIGLAKALALETQLPIVAVPTTYSGSEQTNIWGISTEEGKTTGKSMDVMPKVVVYDSNLTAGLPLSLAVTSGMNAMAHLMEAIYAPNGNPITRHHALLGVEKIKLGLEEVAKEKKLTEQANVNIQFGAYLAGKCLCEVSMSLHHKMAHVLGGSFKLEHSYVHTVLQAFVLNYQWDYLSDEIKSDFVQVLGYQPAQKLQDLSAQAGGPSDLKSIGFKRENIDKAVETVLAKPYENVAPLEKAKLVDMLLHAYEGSLEG